MNYLLQKRTLADPVLREGTHEVRLGRFSAHAQARLSGVSTGSLR